MGDISYFANLLSWFFGNVVGNGWSEGIAHDETKININSVDLRLCDSPTNYLSNKFLPLPCSFNLPCRNRWTINYSPPKTLLFFLLKLLVHKISLIDLINLYIFFSWVHSKSFNHNIVVTLILHSLLILSWASRRCRCSLLPARKKNSIHEKSMKIYMDARTASLNDIFTPPLKVWNEASVAPRRRTTPTRPHVFFLLTFAIPMPCHLPPLSSPRNSFQQ